MDQEQAHEQAGDVRVHDTPTLLFLRKSLPRRFMCYISWCILSDPVLDPTDPEHRLAERATLTAHLQRKGVANVCLPVVVRCKNLLGAWLAENATSVPATVIPAQQPKQRKPWPAEPALEAQGWSQQQPGWEAQQLSIIAAAVPAQHFCPLARCVMREPVRDWRDHEHVYERSAITAFVRQHGCNPVTGQPMCLDHLQRAAFEEDAIRDWVAENTTTTSFSGGGRGDSGRGDGQAAAG
ncbi:hypothetical protein Agub_g8172, partial [Astrephomene gubernaculifera]